jgi:uncharacterized membrane protein YccC
MMTTRYLTAALGALLLFVSGTAVVVAILPAPLGPVDYFLAGGIGTLIASLAVFLGFARWSRMANIFCKRRPREIPPGRSHPPGTRGL